MPKGSHKKNLQNFTLGPKKGGWVFPIANFCLGKSLHIEGRSIINYVPKKLVKLFIFFIFFSYFFGANFNMGGEGVIPYKSSANFSGAKWPGVWGSRELWAKCEVLQIFFLRASPSTCLEPTATHPQVLLVLHSSRDQLTV